MQNEENWNPNN